MSLNLHKKKAENCDGALHDPKRLEAVRRTGLMDTPIEQSFDRLAHLAAKILNAPITIVSVIDDKKQFYKAAHGLPSPLDVIREVPIDASLCRYTLAGETINLGDTSKDSILLNHPTITAFGIEAFLSIPMIDDDGNVIGSFCAVDMKKRPWTQDDIDLMKELTTSVMTEINLRIQILELESERELRNTFVAALTHDLRTPLTVAKLNAQILERGSSAPQEKDRLNKIVDCIDRGDKLIQDLLDASVIKAGRALNLEKIDCNLVHIIRHTLEDLNFIHEDRLVLKSEPEIPGKWDEKALRRILENLVNNAIKYGDQQSVVTITLKKNSKSIELSVHNTGNAIPEEEQRNIFKPFHRMDSALKSPSRGWGLGLTLVKSLTEAHGGEIEVKSNPENGTTFTIHIPLHL